MEGRSGTGHLKVKYYYYVCRNKECGLRVVVEDMEGAVLERVGELAGEEGRAFVTDKLNQLAQRRADIERGISEIDEALAGVRRRAVKAEDVRRALADMHRVYSCLKPFEQKELMRLVLQGAEVNERQIVLEIDQRVCEVTKSPKSVNHKAKLRFESPKWLRR